MDNNSPDSRDRNLKEGWLSWERVDGRYVCFETPVDGRKDLPRVEVVDQEEYWRLKARHDAEEEDEEKEEEEEEEEEKRKQEIYWDEIDARPAGNVLRDIIRWYRELVDLPGARDMDVWHQPREDILRALYQKHRWAGENVDGEAFLVDHVRHTPDVTYIPEEMRPFLKHMVEKSEQDKAAALQRE